MTGEPIRVAALYAAIVEWVDTVMGARDISKLPGLWQGTTRTVGTVGPITVRINGRKHAIDKVPPYHFEIGSDRDAMIGLIGPKDGMLLPSFITGVDEEGLIAHFKAQATAAPAEAEDP